MDKQKQNNGITSDSIYFILLASVLALYIGISWQSINAAFFSLDDVGQIYHVRSFDSWQGVFMPDLFNFFRPVKNALFMAFESLAQQHISLARLLAVSIGIISFVPVNILCRRLLNSRIFGITAAAIWLLAPTMVSSTTWLSCVNIQLGTGLAATSLIFYLRSRKRAKIVNPDFLATWLTAFLAMLSYEGIVSLAGIYFAFEFFLHPGELGKKRTWMRLAAVWSSLAVYLLLRLLMIDSLELGGGFANVSGWQISFSSAYFVLLHFFTWLWPFGRQAVVGCYFWGLVPMGILTASWLLIVALSLSILGLRKKWPLATLGCAWFLIAFLPVSNLIPLKNRPYGDYYLTFSSIGLAILFTALAKTTLQGRRRKYKFQLAIVALLVAWRGAAAIESFRWSQRWNSEYEIYANTVETFPKAYSAINQLARSCYQRNNYERSLALAEHSLEIIDDQETPHLVRALVASRRGEIKKAENIANQMLARASNQEDVLWAYNFKGYLHDEFYKNPEKAAHNYKKALEVETLTWSQAKLQAASALALIKAKKGDFDAAIDLWEQVVQITPDDPGVHNNLAIAYKNAGESRKSREHRIRYNQLIESAQEKVD